MPVAQVVAVVDGNLHASLVGGVMDHVGGDLFAFVSNDAETCRVQEVNAPALLVNRNALELPWKFCRRGRFAPQLRDAAYVEFNAGKSLEPARQFGQVVAGTAVPGIRQPGA